MRNRIEESNKVLLDHHLFFVAGVNALMTELTFNVEPFGNRVCMMEYNAVARNELALVCQHLV